MLSPRNTLVVLKLIDQKEVKQGGLFIPTNGELYSQAVVIAVGPGTIQASGGQRETFDLKPGQTVLVKAKEQRGGLGVAPSVAGVAYREGDNTYHIYEQMSIIGIISEPQSN